MTNNCDFMFFCKILNMQQDMAESVLASPIKL